MENLKETILKIAIIEGYGEKGIDTFYDVIKNKEEARKKAMEENLNNTEFELNRIYTKLKIINILISLKTTEKNKEDRERLADILVETAEELRNIEGEN